MIKFATLMLALFFTFTLSAQNGLKGPQAKNYKPWKSETPARTMYVSQKSTLSGPSAKNTRLWERKVLAEVQVSTAERADIKGPKAKNSKPWN